MNELCLFIKENIWQLIIILTMVSNSHYRKLGLLLVLITLIAGYHKWIYIGFVIFGILIDKLHSVVKNDNSTNHPKRKNPDYE